MPVRNPRRRQRGFTLVELVVVLVIVGAVAGLVIPSVAGLGRTTDMATSAKTQQDLAANLQEFFVLQKRYPQGLDSLLINGTPSGSSTTPDTLGTAGAAPTGLYTPKFDSTNQQQSGMTNSSPALVNVLRLGTLTSNQRRSFTRCGFDYVHDHQGYDWLTATGIANSNDSAIFPRTLPASGTMPAAVIAAGTGVVGSDGVTDTLSMSPTSSEYILMRGLVPSELVANGSNWDWVPEVGTQIVAVGVGPRSRLVPTTMMSTPNYPGNDGKYYGRYVAFFKVFESGERAILVGVSDPYGRTSDYTIQQFNESLPNGARQG